MFAFIKKKKKSWPGCWGWQWGTFPGKESVSHTSCCRLSHQWLLFCICHTGKKKEKKKLSQNCKHFVGPDGIGRVHNGSMKCSLLSFCTRAHDTSLCRTSTPHRLSSSPRTLPATRRTGTSCAGRRTSPVGNIFQTFTLLLEWIATVKLYYGSSLF